MDEKINIPVIETERLLLRKMDKSDVKEIFYLRSDKDMMRYIPRPLCVTEEDALKLIRLIQQGYRKNTGINWGITVKPDNTLIGTVGFVRMHPEHNRAELGYMLDKNHHRKGIMTEAVAKVIEYGFEQMHLHTIEAVIDPGNIASEILLKNFGFEKEAHFKENFLYEGQYLDSVHYTLFEESYRSSIMKQ